MALNVKGQLKEAQLENLASDPANLPRGRFWYDTTLNKIKIAISGAAKFLVTEDGSQTLTNKTLTSPSITAPTGIVKGDVGLGNVDNTSDATKNAATVVLTNKDIDGGTASNTSRITLPKAAKTALDALTRKQGTVVYDTTSNRPYYDDGTNLQLIGSGGGGVNFVTNPDAEAGTAGWTVDSFAAASRPAGSLTATTTGITFTTSASSPLAGANSFTFAKDAVNRQGRVVYTPLTFTPAYFGRVMNISVDVIVASGTFVAGTPTTDSDFIWYIQNVSDGTFIEPSSFKILSNSSTNSFQFVGTFQTAASATSYRLLGYVASTSAADYTLRFDNVTVTPSTYAYGTPITDWQAYTPTFTGFGTATGVNFKWRRSGSDIEIEGRFTTGTTTATEARVSLPSGLVSASNYTTLQLAGKYNQALNSTTNFSGGTTLIEPSVAYITFGRESSTTTGVQKYNGSDIFTNSTLVLLNAKVQIAGQSSSVQTSDQTDTRVVAASGSNTTYTVTTSSGSTKVPFTSINTNTHGTATSAGDYVVPVSGLYRISARSQINSGAGAITIISHIALNSSVIQTAQQASANTHSAVVFTTRDLTAGQTINFYSSVDANSYTLDFNFTIERISGPNQIAASESVNARYTNTAGTSIPNTGENLVPFATRDFDSHNAFVTDTYTCPISGKYEISSVISFTSQAYQVGATLLIVFYKNGLAHSYGASVVTSAASTLNYSIAGNALINCLAGDTIQIRVQNNRSAGATAITTTAGTNHFYIERIGN